MNPNIRGGHLCPPPFNHILMTAVCFIGLILLTVSCGHGMGICH